MEKIDVIIEVSARHIHITQEDLDILFGKNYQLTVLKELSQAGDFASEETVQVIGPKRSFKTVRILGPVREYSQVELSKTDCYYTGIEAPLRLSSHVENSGKCKLIGPAGELEFSSGVIVAKRHFHCSVETAEQYNLQEGDIIDIEITGERASILSEIVVRIHESFRDRIHLDTDEGNAVGIKNGDIVKMIIK